MTAVSLTSGGETTEQVKKPRLRKTEINHLVWVGNLKAAYEMGVDVRSLCGVWVKPWKLKEFDVVEVVGDLVPIYDQDECGNCKRIHAARLNRKWERLHGKGRQR